MQQATLDIHDRHAADPRKISDALNSLLRGEVSAVETYDQAIEKFTNPLQSEVLTVLAHIRDEHILIVNWLRQRITSQGGDPVEGSGVWGSFTQAITSTAKLLGPQTALAALKQGELIGFENFQKTLADSVLPSDYHATLTQEFIQKSQQHVAALDDLIQHLQVDAN